MVVVDCCLWLLVPLVVVFAGLLGLIGCLVAFYFCLVCRVSLLFHCHPFCFRVVWLLRFFLACLPACFCFSFPVYDNIFCRALRRGKKMHGQNFACLAYFRLRFVVFLYFLVPSLFFARSLCFCFLLLVFALQPTLC